MAIEHAIKRNILRKIYEKFKIYKIKILFEVIYRHLKKHRNKKLLDIYKKALEQ